MVIFIVKTITNDIPSVYLYYKAFYLTYTVSEKNRTISIYIQALFSVGGNYRDIKYQVYHVCIYQFLF